MALLPTDSPPETRRTFKSWARAGAGDGGFEHERAHLTVTGRRALLLVIQKWVAVRPPVCKGCASKAQQSKGTSLLEVVWVVPAPEAQHPRRWPYSQLC